MHGMCLNTKQPTVMDHILSLTFISNSCIFLSFSTSSADDTFDALGPADPTFRVGAAAGLIAGDLVVVVVVVLGLDCSREAAGFATPTALRGAEEKKHFKFGES